MTLAGHTLIVGATGFVGRHTLARALNESAQVTVLLRREMETDLPRSADHLITDLADPAGLATDRARLKQITRVIYLAARTAKKGGEQIPLLDLLNDNVAALVGLIERLGPDVNYFCYVSTLDVYGSPAYLPIDEKHPVQPLSPYAASKVAAEIVCRLMLAARKIPFSILRLSHVYGPGEAAYEKMIPISLRKALAGEPIEVFGNGQDERDFVYVGDVARGILAACSHNAEGVFNVAGGTPTKIIDVARTIMELIPGAAMTMVASDRQPTSLYFDISRAAAAFEFAPTTSLNEGLSLEISWFGHQRTFLENK